MAATTENAIDPDAARPAIAEPRGRRSPPCPSSTRITISWDRGVASQASCRTDRADDQRDGQHRRRRSMSIAIPATAPRAGASRSRSARPSSAAGIASLLPPRPAARWATPAPASPAAPSCGKASGWKRSRRDDRGRRRPLQGRHSPDRGLAHPDKRAQGVDMNPAAGLLFDRRLPSAVARPPSPARAAVLRRLGTAYDKLVRQFYEVLASRLPGSWRSSRITPALESASRGLYARRGATSLFAEWSAAIRTLAKAENAMHQARRFFAHEAAGFPAVSVRREATATFRGTRRRLPPLCRDLHRGLQPCAQQRSRATSRSTRRSLFSYANLWNAFIGLGKTLFDAEQDMLLFACTAARFYRLG